MSSIATRPSRAGVAAPVGWPMLALHIASAFAFTAMVFGMSMRHGERFAYPLDDTYIHMALARTLAGSGVWGIDAQTPASASSSPLWTVLLAAVYRAFGWLGEPLHLFAPLLLNLAFVAGVIWLNARILRGIGIWTNLALATTWLFTALPSVAAIGMEHVAHLFFITLFLHQASLRWTRLSAEGPIVPAKADHGVPWLLLASAALAATSRYESTFVIGPIVLLSLLRGQRRQALCIALATALPLLMFGLLWVKGGGWMVPNALLLKGASSRAAEPGLLSWLAGAWRNAANNLTMRSAMVSHAITVIHVALMLLAPRVSGPVAVFSRVTLLAVLAHIALASFGWLYRYDAWLIQLNLLSIFMLLGEQPARMRSAAVQQSAMLACLLILSMRFHGGTVKTPQAMDDRRWEHFMPSDFAQQHLRGQTILVNDLGVLAYRGDARVVDFYGLGNNEPLRMRRSPRGYGAPELAALTRKADGDAAIVQLCWAEVNERLPPDWALIGIWKGGRNVVFGDKVVALFSLKRDRDQTLKRAFDRFVPTAPVESPASGFADAFNRATGKDRQALLSGLCQA